MHKDEGAIIAAISADSIAEEVELEKDDKILSINGFPLIDWIDYCYLINEYELTIDVEKKNGEIWTIEIEKEIEEDLGVEFRSPVFDKLKKCHNQCIFCFVDQMPKGLRKTLYMKDDDYRLSFLQGNYITLTNLSEEEIERIIELRLSPLYISVHVTDPQLRCTMMKNKNAGKVLAIMKRLAEGGISFHTQIVLCPGVNDGVYLEQSIKDLSDLWPYVQSLAIVPVGLTRFRDGLFSLFPVDQQKAQTIIDQVLQWQLKFKEQWGRTWVYLSDEFYLAADKPIPPVDYYDDFPQTENGVGLIRLFLDEFVGLMPLLPQSLEKPREITVATGISAGKFLTPIVKQLNEIKGLKINLVIVPNKFFGETVTVAGLVAGCDLINTLKDKQLGSTVLISYVMLKDDKPVFIDDIAISDLEKILDTHIEVIGDSVMDFLDKVFGSTDWRKEDEKTRCGNCGKA